MIGLKALFKKDVKIFFTTPVFYMVAFMASLIMSWLFPIRLYEFHRGLSSYMFQPGMGSPQQLNIHFALFLQQLSLLNLLLIFLIPALTMKMLSEEKKMRTFDLLLTSPIRSYEIVLGKFLAVAVAILAICLVALSYCAWMGFYTEFSWSMLFLAFAGIFLTGLVYAAMNLFCSALTESSLGAFAMAIVFNVAIWFVGAGADLSDNQTIRSIFEHVSLGTHLGSFVEGNLRTSSIVFLMSLIGLFLFLSERVVEANRWR